MIRLNLIDAAERESLISNVNPVHVTDVSSQVKSSKKRALTVFLTILFVFVAFSCFLSVAGVPKPLQGALPSQYLDLIGAEDPSRSALTLSSGQTTTAGGSLEAQVAEANEAIKRRDALTVNQVVGEINPTVLFNNKRTDFVQFLPMERISFERAAVAQFFTFLNTAAPDDVGFSDCVFQTPNFYYLRGVAAKPTSQRSFLERVKSLSSEFKTPPIPENAPATDITAFGKFNVTNVNMNAVTRFVPAADQAEEIKSLKALAGTHKVTLNGFDKPTVEDFGVYKRFAYQVSTSCDYPELQQFFAALSESPIRAAVQKVELKFAKRNMQVAMRIEMFVSP